MNTAHSAAFSLSPHAIVFIRANSPLLMQQASSRRARQL
jgi:hypothetical protein